MEHKGITDEMREKLRAPFPEDAYRAHPTKTFLTTLKAMYVTERLNDVFGVGRWHIEPEVIERTDNYVLIKGVFMSLDYEVSSIIQYGGHSTTGTNVEIADGYKSALTDCMSKIASYLEVGIDMFKGKINPPNSGRKDSETVPEKVLTQKEVELWNGKIYGANQVYINNVRCQIGEEQLNKLKALPKYKPQEK
jgi:hypothetical protein